MSVSKADNSPQPESAAKLAQPLRILMLEDTPADAELNERMLRKAGMVFDSLRVETLNTFVAALDSFHPDLILADYHLLGFDGMAALSLVRTRNLEIPFIFVTGAMGEELAVESIKQGATDYILKDRLSRLPAAVQRALAEKQQQQQLKRREDELLESEARYRRITEGLTDYQYTVRIENGRAVETKQSPACVTVTGYTAEELVADPYLWIQMVAPEDRDLVRARVSQILTGNDVPSLEHKIIRKDGAIRWVRDTTILFKDAAGKLLSYDGVIKDITERMQAVIALNHANRALATLSVVNRNLVRATNEDELLQTICQAIVEQRGYRMAWVGYAQQDADKTIKVMAHAGHDEDYLEALQLTWAEAVRGMGPCGRAIRGGTTQLCQDIANDPHYPPWRDAALKRGYAASITLPLVDGDGKVFGILTVYAEEVNAFSSTEVDLLEEMAGDLAFGVRGLHIRHERDLAQEQNQKQLVQLQNSLEDTVRVIATIVEKRDPYTAGHQARVADLAAAIARQMGLPDERVHAIQLASVVHDLGKIQIPAEILSKPGRLNEIEYSFIKTHPQAGYDILKNISFPWPLAQMVLQHHEHFDGSGYPLGSNGDQIILEARIISVADVVEAMSSHRPYRAGLGVEAALAEITCQRGIFFDPQVVDACLTLFRELNYTLPT
ncbi:MAG: GAF domain-containing protein [Gallionella sp.]|nr:GAF domain-containing protein [Gallionella sp.]